MYLSPQAIGDRTCSRWQTPAELLSNEPLPADYRPRPLPLPVAPLPLHMRRGHYLNAKRAEADARMAAIDAFEAARFEMQERHEKNVVADEFQFQSLPAKKAREEQATNPWAVRYEDRYHLPSRARFKALEKNDRESLFDASLLRTQLRAAENMRAEGVMVPLASQSSNVLKESMQHWQNQSGGVRNIMSTCACWRAMVGLNEGSLVLATRISCQALGAGRASRPSYALCEIHSQGKTHEWRRNPIPPHDHP